MNNIISRSKKYIHYAAIELYGDSYADKAKYSKCKFLQPLVQFLAVSFFVSYIRGEFGTHTGQLERKSRGPIQVLQITMESLFAIFQTDLLFTIYSVRMYLGYGQPVVLQSFKKVRHGYNLLMLWIIAIKLTICYYLCRKPAWCWPCALASSKENGKTYCLRIELFEYELAKSFPIA